MKFSIIIMVICLVLHLFHKKLGSGMACGQGKRSWQQRCQKHYNIFQMSTSRLYIQILQELYSAYHVRASVEMANSALAFVKTDSRSTMTQDRFNALVLIFVHRDISINYDKVIELYASKYPRRMLFLNTLGEE